MWHSTLGVRGASTNLQEAGLETLRQRRCAQTSPCLYLHGVGPHPRQVSCPHIGQQMFGMLPPPTWMPPLPRATPAVAWQALLLSGP